MTIKKLKGKLRYTKSHVHNPSVVVSIPPLKKHLCQKFKNRVNNLIIGQKLLYYNRKFNQKNCSSYEIDEKQILSYESRDEDLLDYTTEDITEGPAIVNLPSKTNLSFESSGFQLEEEIEEDPEKQKEKGKQIYEEREEEREEEIEEQMEKQRKKQKPEEAIKEIEEQMEKQRNKQIPEEAIKEVVVDEVKTINWKLQKLEKAFLLKYLETTLQKYDKHTCMQTLIPSRHKRYMVNQRWNLPTRSSYVGQLGAKDCLRIWLKGKMTSSIKRSMLKNKCTQTSIDEVMKESIRHFKRWIKKSFLIVEAIDSTIKYNDATPLVIFDSKSLKLFKSVVKRIHEGEKFTTTFEGDEWSNSENTYESDDDESNEEVEENYDCVTNKEIAKTRDLKPTPQKELSLKTTLGLRVSDTISAMITSTIKTPTIKTPKIKTPAIKTPTIKTPTMKASTNKTPTTIKQSDKNIASISETTSNVVIDDRKMITEPIDQFDLEKEQSKFVTIQEGKSNDDDNFNEIIYFLQDKNINIKTIFAYKTYIHTLLILISEATQRLLYTVPFTDDPCIGFSHCLSSLQMDAKLAKQSFMDSMTEDILDECKSISKYVTEKSGNDDPFFPLLNTIDQLIDESTTTFDPKIINVIKDIIIFREFVTTIHTMVVKFDHTLLGRFFNSLHDKCESDDSDLVIINEIIDDIDLLANALAIVQLWHERRHEKISANDISSKSVFDNFSETHTHSSDYEQINIEMVKNWLQDLTSTLSDADDIIDVYENFYNVSTSHDVKKLKDFFVDPDLLNKLISNISVTPLICYKVNQICQTYRLATAKKVTKPTAAYAIEKVEELLSSPALIAQFLSIMSYLADEEEIINVKNLFIQNDDVLLNHYLQKGKAVILIKLYKVGSWLSLLDKHWTFTDVGEFIGLKDKFVKHVSKIVKTANIDSVVKDIVNDSILLTEAIGAVRRYITSQAETELVDAEYHSEEIKNRKFSKTEDIPEMLELSKAKGKNHRFSNSEAEKNEVTFNVNEQSETLNVTSFKNMKSNLGAQLEERNFKKKEVEDKKEKYTEQNTEVIDGAIAEEVSKDEATDSNNRQLASTKPAIIYQQCVKDENNKYSAKFPDRVVPEKINSMLEMSSMLEKVESIDETDQNIVEMIKTENNELNILVEETVSTNEEKTNDDDQETDHKPVSNVSVDIYSEKVVLRETGPSESLNAEKVSLHNELNLLMVQLDDTMTSIEVQCQYLNEIDIQMPKFSNSQFCESTTLIQQSKIVYSDEHDARSRLSSDGKVKSVKVDEKFFAISPNSDLTVEAEVDVSLVDPITSSKIISENASEAVNVHVITSQDSDLMESTTVFGKNDRGPSVDDVQERENNDTEPNVEPTKKKLLEFEEEMHIPIQSKKSNDVSVEEDRAEYRLSFTNQLIDSAYNYRRIESPGDEFSGFNCGFFNPNERIFEQSFDDNVISNFPAKEIDNKQQMPADIAFNECGQFSAGGIEVEERSEKILEMDEVEDLLVNPEDVNVSITNSAGEVVSGERMSFNSHLNLLTEQLDETIASIDIKYKELMEMDVGADGLKLLQSSDLDARVSINEIIENCDVEAGPNATFSNQIHDVELKLDETIELVDKIQRVLTEVENTDENGECNMFKSVTESRESETRPEVSVPVIEKKISDEIIVEKSKSRSDECMVWTNDDSKDNDSKPEPPEVIIEKRSQASQIEIAEESVSCDNATEELSLTADEAISALGFVVYYLLTVLAGRQSQR